MDGNDQLIKPPPLPVEPARKRPSFWRTPVVAGCDWSGAQRADRCLTVCLRNRHGHRLGS
ncbi:MAG: hypothetical protein ACJAYX_003784 [Planctomycetota bacterium]|jgi:hypothetical protein